MMKLAALPLFLTAFALTSAPIHAEETPEAQPAPMPPKQTLLEQPIDLNTSKIQASVFRLTLPKGFKTPQHVHDGPGPRYVVKGRVKIEEAGQTAEYGPGQVFWETGGVMTAENISEGEAELIIFEVSPRKAAPAPEAATPKK
jgi:quercetin dioxygenase-like cupin family protein